MHLEIILKDLKDLAGVEFVQEEPVVSYMETILATSEQPLLAKSANKLNRLWFTAEPLSESLADAIDAGKFNTKVYRSLVL